MSAAGSAACFPRSQVAGDSQVTFPVTVLSPPIVYTGTVMTSSCSIFGLTRTPAPRWVAHLQFAVFVGIGVALLIGGMRRYDAAQPIAGGRTTTGTVISVGTGQNCGRHGCSAYWVPTIQFTAANGRAFTFAGPESGSPVDTGAPVQVSYDPGNPAVARDMSAGAGNAWMLIGFGALAILAGAASFLLGFRRFHALLNLTPARDGSGWVGHSGLHSVRGVSAAVAVLAAIVIVQHALH
jgi:hypothetical protein